MGLESGNFGSENGNIFLERWLASEGYKNQSVTKIKIFVTLWFYILCSESPIFSLIKGVLRISYFVEKANFWNSAFLSGLREYSSSSPLLALDVDAGPVLFGLSPSGTAFATGSATFFGDKDMRVAILRTSEIAGNTVAQKGKHHYALADIALVGEAIMLAMSTSK